MLKVEETPPKVVVGVKAHDPVVWLDRLSAIFRWAFVTYKIIVLNRAYVYNMFIILYRAFVLYIVINFI